MAFTTRLEGLERSLADAAATAGMAKKRARNIKGMMKGQLRKKGIRGARNMLNIRVVSWSLGLFLAISYLLCVLYGLIVPERLHGMSAFLEAVLPAFKWLTLGGFIPGLAESFLYGVYIGIVFVPVYNSINRKWGFRS